MANLLVLTAGSPASSSRMLVCPSEELIQDLLAGRLVLSQAAQLHQHFESCPACRALLASLGRAESATPDDELPFVDPENYYLDGQFARGGLGRILKARDQRLGRVVAIKQLLHDSRQAAARFRREALVTARLQHPAIIPVYEAGRWPSGELFYAMRLVAGRSLDDVLDDARTLDARLALVPNIIAVADAVAYAHGQGVVHRDLKPANILVGEFGETVVIDWGLAKLVADPSTETLADQSGELSLAGSILGTPAYMPPEQARGDAVDARADVYALGAVLYHFLVGKAPYRGSAREILEQVLAGEPPPVELGAPGAPAELVAIVERAMARDAAARYPSAAELAEDLRRFVTGQLVRAHRYTRGQMVRRWLKRHQLLTATLGVLLVSGSLGLWRILQERDRAEKARAAAEAGRIELLWLEANSSLEHDPTASLAWLDRYLEVGGPAGRAWELAADLVGRGVASAVTNGPERSALSPDGSTLALPAAPGRVRLLDVDRGSWRAVQSAVHEDVQLMIWAPDGKKLLVGHAKKNEVISLDGGGDLLLEGPGGMWHAVFSPDGRRLLAGGSLSHLEMGLYDLTNGTRRSLPIAGERVWMALPFFDADGHARAVETNHDTMVVHDFDSGTRQLLHSVDGPPQALKTLRGGSTIGFQIVNGGLRLWDATTGKTRAIGATEATDADVSADGRTVAWITDNLATSQDTTSGTRTPLTMPSAPQHLEFAPRGRVLAVTAGDGSIAVWDDTSLARTLLGQHGAVHTSFSDDGGRLLSRSSESGNLRIWRLGDLPTVLARATEGVRAMALSPDGTRLATAGLASAQVWDPAGGESRALPAAAGSPALAWSPDGARLALSVGREVRVCPRAGECRVLDGGGRVGALGFSPDGRTLVAAGDGGVRLWTLDGFAVRTLADDGDVWQLEISAAGDRLALAGLDRRVRVWDLAAGTRTLYEGHTASVSRVRFSHDGKSLASGSADGTVRLWDLSSGKARILQRVDASVNELALSPDGKKLAFIDASHLVKLWDPAGDRVMLLAGHDGEVNDLTFSPDGTLLASASADHTARIWDVVNGHPAQVLRGHSAAVRCVLFAADGRAVWTAGDDATVRRWPLEPALGPHSALRAWLRTLSTVRIDAEGSPVTP